MGTPPWMAPELLAHRRYGLSADVYSFGIVLWELAAHQTPWSSVNSIVGLAHLVESGQRPQIPVDGSWPPQFVAIMQQCWAAQPSDRPTFSRLCALFSVNAAASGMSGHGSGGEEVGGGVSMM